MESDNLKHIKIKYKKIFERKIIANYLWENLSRNHNPIPYINSSQNTTLIKQRIKNIIQDTIKSSASLKYGIRKMIIAKESVPA